jgi:HEXXH motif-containing protein
MITEQINEFLRPPFAGCDPDLAVALAELELQRFISITNLTESQYSIINCLRPTVSGMAKCWALGEGLPQLELPNFNQLINFYAEHGLEPLSEDELLSSQASKKLHHAWILLASVPAVQGSVQSLVKTIQVLRSPDPEIDVSYSHPDIPFSVFVSVGEDCSLVATLRVAESLLHEAMHLKLTLLEKEIPLLQADSQGFYYSPWRDEYRPARGVLHGLFVFTVVHAFYSVLRKQAGLSAEASLFICHRMEDIKGEIDQVKGFEHALDLTAAGKALVSTLIEYRGVECNQ